MTTTQPRTGGLEVRSIDYVPLNERHGKIWHLGPLSVSALLGERGDCDVRPAEAVEVQQHEL
jgi:hypothetical protein